MMATNALSYIDTLKKKGFWTWEELRCLAQALGFNRNLFQNYSTEVQRKNGGFSMKELQLLIDAKQLNASLHCTFNSHDSGYNVKVLQVALSMVNSRIINFTELHLARMAFQFYEHFDQGGMQLEEYLLLRALKLCGRCVAPLKLMNHVKRLDRLVEDRVMLYEFLEVLPITSPSPSGKEASVSDQLTISEEDKDLYQLCDFESLLQTSDQRLWKNLDAKHQNSVAESSGKKSRGAPQNRFNSLAWFCPPLVDRRKWRAQVAWGRFQKEVINEEIQRSEAKAKQSLQSTLCVCEQARLSSPKARERKPEIQPEEKEPQHKLEANETPVQPKKRLWQRQRELIVSEEELAAMELRRLDLQFDIDTQAERFRQQLAVKNASYTKRFIANQKQREFNRLAAKSRETNTTASLFQISGSPDVTDKNSYRASWS